MIPEYRPRHTIGCLLALFLAGLAIGITIGLLLFAR